MENAIEIVAIIKQYEGFKLEISNVKIQHGEKVGIIGNNGMGKKHFF
jgi:translation initiation factor RLI1